MLTDKYLLIKSHFYISTWDIELWMAAKHQYPRNEGSNTFLSSTSYHLDPYRAPFNALQLKNAGVDTHSHHLDIIAPLSHLISALCLI